MGKSGDNEMIAAAQINKEAEQKLSQLRHDLNNHLLTVMLTMEMLEEGAQLSREDYQLLSEAIYSMQKAVEDSK